MSPRFSSVAEHASSPDPVREEHPRALRLIDCYKRFRSRGGDEVVALDSISLTVPRGQIVGLIGSNGAGKSTLVGAIAGSVILDTGTIEVSDVDVTDDPSWRRSSRIALVRQNPSDNICAPLTVEQNFALALDGGSGVRLWTGKRAVNDEIRRKARQELSRFGMGLEGRLQTPVHLLSGGQRQAVAVAMATARMPDVLLADEHTAALDPRSAHNVLAVTEAIVRDDAITAIVITHDMGVALRHSDRVVLMHHGSIVVDISGCEKRSLDEPGLVALFRSATGEGLPDRTMLGS